ncbi:Gas vesicle protein GvpFL [Frankia sp. AiPs1]|uniref:GvpL/GvpF family gas vesicle protein n=1 Tax=Frankia sp. AiPa1 TaxID=573492 RepID=UPI00202B7C21|nr:GvpL/GvpF family gas vesicle protein [Frankia sp. AiPa1]MCL9759726.1 GvpL/GvpF family gas vesicle protein [Frankia sp. AiPa1]
MATADADFGSLDDLAARLAPGIITEAVTEAREVARGQLVQLLAREITRAACERAAMTAAPSVGADMSSGTVQQGRRPQGRHESPPGREDRLRDRGDHRHDGPSLDHRDDPDPGPGPGSGSGRGLGPGLRDGRPLGGVERAPALYAYGIVSAGTDISDLPGLAEGTRVGAVTRDRVSLVVSDIDPDLLHDLEEDLSEAGPLATLARGHDQVLRDLQDRGAVLPLRFGTVLPGEREAADILDDPDAELPRALAALHDAREWGFRIDAAGQAETRAEEVGRAEGVAGPSGVGASTGASWSNPAGPSGGADPGAGAAYLSARRDELREQERQRKETARLVERAHRELLAHARDVARRPGRPDRVFDCAYLVDRDDEEEFLDAAERLGPPLERVGCAAVVTGPWPPYSFVHLTLGGEGRTGSGSTAESTGAVDGMAAESVLSARSAVPYGGRAGNDAAAEEAVRETGEGRG